RSSSMWTKRIFSLLARNVAEVALAFLAADNFFTFVGRVFRSERHTNFVSVGYITFSGTGLFSLLRAIPVTLYQGISYVLTGIGRAVSAYWRPNRQATTTTPLATAQATTPQTTADTMTDDERRRAANARRRAMQNVQRQQRDFAQTTQTTQPASKTFVRRNADKFVHWLHSKFENTWTRFFPQPDVGPFETALDFAIQTRDFSIFWDYLEQSADTYDRNARFAIIDWRQHLIEQVNNNRFTSDNYWHGINSEQLNAAADTHPWLCSAISGELMRVPVFLTHGNGFHKTSFDLFELLKHIIENGATNPVSRDHIRVLNDIKFDHDKYRRLENLKASLRAGVHAEPENRFDEVMQRALTENDFDAVLRFLRENALNPSGWNEELTYELAHSKYNSRNPQNIWSEQLTPEQRAGVEEQNTELCCAHIAHALMCVPVYLEKENGRTYLDLCSLLEHMKRNWTNPETRVRIASLEAIKFDRDLYEQMPKYVATAKAWHDAKVAHNPQQFIDFLHANNPQVTVVESRSRPDIYGQSEVMVSLRFNMWWPGLTEAVTKIRSNEDNFWPANAPAPARDFICPISSKVMRNPVSIMIGGTKQYFDLQPLLLWFSGSAQIPGTSEYLVTLNQIKYEPELKERITQAIQQVNPAVMPIAPAFQTAIAANPGFAVMPPPSAPVMPNGHNVQYIPQQ
ncbi:MAG TPA: hypothetical protein VLG38_04275, partial [Gammaproteobacteria bacterium]|nr:hypothetical protein [Gammaproteobacteria bacterium]